MFIIKGGKKKIKPMTKKHFTNKINKWKKTVKLYNHDVNKLGYRNDCSGFVSFLWGLPKDISRGGPRTRGRGKNNLRYWGKKIRKRDLKRGDIMLVGKPSYHVIVFDRWANRNKDEYYIYEMCDRKCCKNFEYMKIQYPYRTCLRPYFKNPVLLRRNTRKIKKYQF